MKILVKLRTMLNVSWGTKVNGREAFFFMRGFPATFMLSQRRAIVVAAFTEKQGWFQKKRLHTLCFEAGLHQVKEYKMDIVPQRRIVSAHMKFHVHGQLAEDAMIQFLRMPPDIWNAIIGHLDTLKIKEPVLDAGIVHVDDKDPRAWLKDRYGLQPGVNY
ncbi:MAG: hypothetical protein JW839_21340 [Candidatus Lokiarchaeota archaeon]|nr:hypothetical protein [Candidatus Lokiarchaeota archaeon]